MGIPVVDIFAGPGGLGEGFSSLLNNKKEREFKIVLSIEKDSEAHKTLTLRSFFRQFPPGHVPDEYYSFVRGELKIGELYECFPEQAAIAKSEAWQAELGKISNTEVDNRITQSLGGERNWLLIGGPPCQAYSVVGRSRRKERILDPAKDHRVELYKQYLRILAVHNPAVFVMENVKGILSAKTEESPVFASILADLSNPADTLEGEENKKKNRFQCPGYKIYSLVKSPNSYDLNGRPVFKHKDFIIESEKYKIPQTRHRVILLGVRNDIDFETTTLEISDPIPLQNVVDDLPRLRSGISDRENTGKLWLNAINAINLSSSELPAGEAVFNSIREYLKEIKYLNLDIGSNYVTNPYLSCPFEKGWFHDSKLSGVLNHLTRSHMVLDLHRYMYASCFGEIYGKSPKLCEFPMRLRPNHKNIIESIDGKKFNDRFRVQLANQPAKTITSHIAKDGHYYIHPDPNQCRSFTVREAARVQTFPDNYYFCGSRTAQYHQVGNAVPPYLAYQIGEIVRDIFLKLHKKESENEVNLLKQLEVEIERVVPC